MHIQFRYRVTLDLWTHDLDTGNDDCIWHTFHAGDVVEIGEVSSINGWRSTVEFIGLGYAEVNDDAWTDYLEPIYRFRPDNETKN